VREKEEREELRPRLRLWPGIMDGMGSVGVRMTVTERIVAMGITYDQVDTSRRVPTGSTRSISFKRVRFSAELLPCPIRTSQLTYDAPEVSTQSSLGQAARRGQVNKFAVSPLARPSSRVPCTRPSYGIHRQGSDR
jgi:hypothetical protein